MNQPAEPDPAPGAASRSSSADRSEDSGAAPALSAGGRETTGGFVRSSEAGEPTERDASLAGRRLLIVHPGAPKKRFILQRLKRLGLTMLCLHNRAEAWARPYVDHWILYESGPVTATGGADEARASGGVSDPAALRRERALAALQLWLSSNPELRPEGALTFWEDDVLLTAEITDSLGLPGIPFERARIARNKHLFREFCRANGVPAPQHRLLQSEDDLAHVEARFAFPVVVKPIFGSSSAFVMKAADAAELRRQHQYIRTHLSTGVESALADGAGILCEEYIDGFEVDVDLLIQNGKIKFSSISDNESTREPFFVETGQTIPSQLPPAAQRALLECAEETLEKMGVQNGCIHFEARHTTRGPVPIEVNLRMGGDEVYSFVRGAWGADLIREAARIALGIHIKRIARPDEPRKFLTGRYFLPERSGVLTRARISEEASKLPFVEELVFFKKTGERVLVPPEGFESLGWITCSGASFREARENLERALKLVRYEVSRFHPASAMGKSLRRDQHSLAFLPDPGAEEGAVLRRRQGRIEKIRRLDIKNQRGLHVGVACNDYRPPQADDAIDQDAQRGAAVEGELAAVGRNIRAALDERGYRTSFLDFNEPASVLEQLRSGDIDFVFNVCERINDSSLLEPHAASLLDVFQMPYTGSSPFTLALAIDKIRVKKLLSFHDIPTPRWDYAYAMDDPLRDDLVYPLIIKPANSDNSLGITNESVVTDRRGLMQQLERIVVGYGRPALVEEYVEGDEYDVSLLGDGEDDLRALPLSRSVFAAMPPGYWHIYPYAAKWGEDPAYGSIEVQRPPRNIPRRLAALITEIAMDTYKILDCRDYGRVEIRVDRSGNPCVLELNPNPSINRGDCLPEVAALAGLDYGDFLEEIMRLAIKRYKNRPPYHHLQGSLL